jgi:hypothetical protein
MSFGWWTIFDIHSKLLSVKNPSELQFLTPTGAPGTYYYTPIKGTSIFSLVHSPSEWHTYTIHVSIVSRLKNSVSSPRIEVDLTGDINKGSYL